MLKLINILFDILGLNRLNIDNFTDMNVIYDNYDDIHKNKDKVNKCRIAYRIIIGLFLLMKPVYYFYEIIEDGSRIFYPTLLFLINTFINYIILLKYFKNNYFENILFDYFPLSKKNKNVKCLVNDYFVPLSILFLSIFTVLFTFFYNMYLYDFGNSTLYNTTLIYNLEDKMELTIFINVLVGITDFYGYILILTNNFIFLLVFLKHLIDVKSYTDKLLKKYSWSKDTKHTEVSSICYEIMWIRNELENSIDSLEPLFVSNTLLGSIAIGFIIEFNEITIFQIISIIYWLVSQLIYLAVIYFINDNKSDLTLIIKKPRFVLHYIRRKFKKSQFDTVIDQVNLKRPRKYISKVFKEEINNELKEIKIDVKEGDDDINAVLGNLDLDEEKREKVNTEEYIVKNSSSIDWIILNTILNESWGSFSFLGFEFSGSNNLLSVISTSGAIILITKWFLTLNLI